MKSRKDLFDVMIGKTVQSVNSTCINVIYIKFTDGTTHSIDCDEQHYGIGVINIDSEGDEDGV